MAKKPQAVPEAGVLDNTALANKPTYRVSEVATYYGVTERTVYLWIDHGHLEIVMTPAGQKRISRESLDRCRFAKKDVEESILA